MTLVGLMAIECLAATGAIEGSAWCFATGIGQFRWGPVVAIGLVIFARLDGVRSGVSWFAC